MAATAIAVTDRIVMVPIAQIKPYHRNPRRNDATVDKLVELIPKVGFNVPLVLDRDNVIVKGHTRWKAGIRLAMTALPCVYSDADEETIRLDRLADNRVQEFSGWDTDLLKSELGALNLPFEFDLGSLNFDIGVAGSVNFDINTPTEPAQVVAAPPQENGQDHTGAGTDEGAAQPEPPAQPDYLEVVCNKCGNHLFVAKE
jgi:hypothetical protein